MKKTVLTILTTILVLNLLAQENTTKIENQNLRYQKPYGLSLGGAKFIGMKSIIGFISADYFIVPQVSLEANIGNTDLEHPYVAIGGKYHLIPTNSTNRLAPFVGLLVGSEYGNIMLQAPIGLNYITSKGLNISVSFNQLVYVESASTTFVDLKIGWRFNR